MYLNLTIIAALLFLYSLVAARLEKTPFSGAMIFVAFGLIFGPDGLGMIDLKLDAEPIRMLAELALALVLFTDAAKADLSVLKQSYQIPVRLLLLGLPLVILLGFALGVLLFDHLSLLEVALLATVLAPTDAALGKGVIINKAIPPRIREGLNFESGLNDGICLPILLILIAFAVGSEKAKWTVKSILDNFLHDIGIGIGVGITFTLLGAFLFNRADTRNWVGEVWRQITIPAFALTCFAGAQFLGGSGFIASFVAGLIAGAIMRRKKEAVLLASEGIGNALSLFTWVTCGTVAIGSASEHFAWAALVYAVLSLTLIRVLPVFLSVSGMGLAVPEKLFLGWFGPRGIASIVFTVLVLNEDLPGGDTIMQTVVWTVCLSILAHGLSANRLTNLLHTKSSVSSVPRKPSIP